MSNLNNTSKHCVSIANLTYEELMQYWSDIKMFEIRKDLLNFTNEQYQFLFSSSKPSIATFRVKNKDENQTIPFLKQSILWGANFVDIDYNTKPEIKKEIVDFAHQNNCQVIISYHDFETTPEQATMEHWIVDAQKQQADWVKIAVQTTCKSDLLKVISLYQKFENIIAFGMGKFGPISRLIALSFGAPFAYTSINKALQTAEGQLDYKTFDAITHLLEYKS